MKRLTKNTVYDLIKHEFDRGMVDDYRKVVKRLDLKRDTLSQVHAFKNAVEHAKVYTLSDTFAMHAEDVSIEHIDKLPWFLASGKPSFPRMFLNDDTVARLKRGQEKGVSLVGVKGVDLDAEVAPFGYMVVDKGGWVEVTMVADLASQGQKAEASILPYNLCYAYEGELPEDVLQGAQAMASVVVPSIDVQMSNSVTADHLLVKLALGAMGKQYNPMIAMMERRVCIAPNVWGSLRYEMDKHDHGNTKQFAHRLMMLVHETAGSSRYLIAAMAILNDIPLKVVERAAVERGRVKTVGRSTPKRNDTVIYLNVLFRRSRAVTSRLIGKMLVHANRKRHPVRGHWMYFGRDENCSGEGMCEWPLQFSDHQVCATCGVKRTFRKAHERGHIELGYVNKEYKV